MKFNLFIYHSSCRVELIWMTAFLKVHRQERETVKVGLKKSNNIPVPPTQWFRRPYDIISKILY